MPEQTAKKTSKSSQRKKYCAGSTDVRNKKRRMERHLKRLLKKERHAKRWVKKNLGEDLASKVAMDKETKRLGVTVTEETGTGEAKQYVRGNMRVFRRQVQKARRGTK